MAADFSQPLLGAVLGFSMGTVLHEFGHVLCARAVGLPIARCVIGRGPLLLSWRQGGTEFEIHASLVGGQTYPYPTFRRQKAAELTLVFGGVLGNVVTILLAIALGAFCRLPAGIGAVIVLVQLYLIATNLYPRRFRIGGKEIDSDGLLIRKLLTQKDGEAFALGPAYLAELRRYDPGVAEDTVVASSRAPLILYWYARLERMSDAAVFQRMQAALDPVVHSQAAAKAERLFVLDMLLTDGLLLQPPAAIETLLAWSSLALEIDPASEILLETRAAILIEAGRYKEGQEILARLGPAQGNLATALRHLFLARAKHHLGDNAAAHAHLDAVKVIADAGHLPPPIIIRLNQIIGEIGVVPATVAIISEQKAALAT